MRNMRAARASPRCGAKTRAGSACLQPAMKNGRCRMHGGASTGPRTCDGLERMRDARTIHGGYSSAVKELRALAQILKLGAKRAVDLG